MAERSTYSLSLEGEGWGEGERLTAKHCVSFCFYSPHPNPLPGGERGRERLRGGGNG